LNLYCAFGFCIESILLAETRKIFFRQHRSDSVLLVNANSTGLPSHADLNGSRRDVVEVPSTAIDPFRAHRQAPETTGGRSVRARYIKASYLGRMLAAAPMDIGAHLVKALGSPSGLV
jgi:hypothetical protein